MTALRVIGRALAFTLAVLALLLLIAIAVLNFLTEYKTPED